MLIQYSKLQSFIYFDLKKIHFFERQKLIISAQNDFKLYISKFTRQAHVDLIEIKMTRLSELMICMKGFLSGEFSPKDVLACRLHGH